MMEGVARVVEAVAPAVEQERELFFAQGAEVHLELAGQHRDVDAEVLRPHFLQDGSDLESDAGISIQRKFDRRQPGAARVSGLGQQPAGFCGVKGEAPCA